MQYWLAPWKHQMKASILPPNMPYFEITVVHGEPVFVSKHGEVMPRTTSPWFPDVFAELSEIRAGFPEAGDASAE